MNKKSIVLGGGCFWCVEAVFQKVVGVEKVRSGYAGGNTRNPTYRDVCSGRTGHAEVVLIEYDADEILLNQILEVFWATHDPTTLNRQGNDRGTQYRSAIYYTDDNDVEIIKNSIEELTESGAYSNPIGTEVAPLESFYPAEVEHDNYYKLNPGNPYCSAVIPPKIKKLMALDIKTN